MSFLGPKPTQDPMNIVFVSNPSKTDTPMVHGKGGVDRPVTPPLAKVMTKTRFLAFLGVFGPFSGPAGPETL